MSKNQFIGVFGAFCFDRRSGNTYIYTPVNIITKSEILKNGLILLCSIRILSISINGIFTAYVGYLRAVPDPAIKKMSRIVRNINIL